MVRHQIRWGTKMARGEITGKKPKQSTDRAKRRRGPPRADVVESMSRDEPDSNTDMKAKPVREPTAVYSIKSFCIAHGISEGFYFKLRQQGCGPAEVRLGTRVFITFESADRWRRRHEREGIGVGEVA